MSSFFGNISNSSRSQLVFDRVYPNRKRLEEDLKNDLDNIFVGRFTIVVYDDNATKRRPGYLKQGEGRFGNSFNYNLEYYKIYKDYECEFPYKLKNGDVDQGYGIFPNDIFAVEIGTEYFYFQCVQRKDAEDDIAWCKFITHITRNEDLTNYALNYLEDKNYFGKDFPSKGYDATIWKKAIRNGEAFFQMIGCLNSDSPTFSAEAGPPSAVPKSPTFGSLSTNKNMTLWYPSSWGFRLKPAKDGEPSDVKAFPSVLVNENNEIILDDKNSYDAALYYNQDGFDSTYNKKDLNTATEMSITTGSSGKIYRNEEGNANVYPDFQELKMYLPEIGNAVADLWNIVYGEGEFTAAGDLKRNKDIQWNSSAGLRMVTTDPEQGGYVLNPKITETLAGSINSVHDLMGMIITEIPDNITSDAALENALENRIYYGDLNNSGQKGFYFKDKYYILEAFENLDPPWTEDEIKNFIGGRSYQDLIPFDRYRYYTFEDNNFYNDRNVSFSESTPYYKIGEPIKVELLQWQDVDEEGKIKYYYYIDNNNDYIKDTSDIPDLTKTYYDIETEEITNANNKLLWDGTQEIVFYSPEDESEENVAKYNQLINILIEAGYQTDSIEGVGSGYFFSKRDEDDNTIILPISANIYPNENDGSSNLNTNYNYYYLDQIALIKMQSDIGQDVNIYFIIDKNGKVVALSEYDSLNSYKVIFYDPDKQAYYQAFSKEDNGKIIEGYTSLKKDNNNKWIIDNSKPYVIIASQKQITTPNEEVDPETGEMVPILFYTPGEYFTCIEEYKQCTNNDTFKDYLYYASRQQDGTYLRLKLSEEEYNAYDDKTLLFFLLRDYYVSNSLIKEEDKIYYRLTKIEKDDKNKDILKELKKDENGEWEISPISANFYQPNKYYYYSNSAPADKKDVLDQSEEMREIGDDTVKDYIDYTDPNNPKIYYLLNYAYVVYDKFNVLNIGSRWDKNAPVPNGVQLGKRKEEYRWIELPGFAKTLNTIHGLILNVNKMFRFNDPYIRDDTSVQGMLNQIRDITHSFENLNPGDVVTVNSYGQLTGKTGLGEVILKGYNHSDKITDIEAIDTLATALSKLQNRIIELEKKIAILETQG